MLLLELDTRNSAPKTYYFAYGMLTDPRNMHGAEFIGRASAHCVKWPNKADVEVNWHTGWPI
jgi:hypothetical protein